MDFDNNQIQKKSLPLAISMVKYTDSIWNMPEFCSSLWISVAVISHLTTTIAGKRIGFINT